MDREGESEAAVAAVKSQTRASTDYFFEIMHNKNLIKQLEFADVIIFLLQILQISPN